MRTSNSRYVLQLVAVMSSCLVVKVLAQRTASGGGTTSRQAGCVATTCTYTVDIGLADCNGRHLACLPLAFNQAVNMDMGQNKVRVLTRGILTGYMRLRSLDLSNNLISTIGDGAFNAVKTLKTLTLSFNQIGRIDKGTFSGLSNLQNLYLQGNRIAVLHPNAFHGLTGMLDLNLAGNRLVTLPDSVFSPMVNLWRLMLHENQLSTGNRFLTGLRSLVELDLDGNRFTTLPDLSEMRMLGDLEITNSNIRRIRNNSFADCGRIKELILASNSIDTIDVAGFEGLRDLSDLHLSSNVLKTLPETVFSKMYLLERVYLQNNLLTSLTTKHFAALTRLRVLNLANNKLASFPPMPASSSLGLLDLSSNQLSTVTQEVLSPLRSLSRLFLLHNPLQCDCRLRYLRQWFINSGRRHRPSEIPHCDSPASLSTTRLTTAQASLLSCTPPSVWAPTTAVETLEGRNISLDCSGAGGFPSPAITWRSPNNQELFPDVISGRYLVTDDGPILIIRAKVSDSGLFTCVGSNPAGMATVAIALRVNNDPNIIDTTPATGQVNFTTPPADSPVTFGTERSVTEYVDFVTTTVFFPDKSSTQTPRKEEIPKLPEKKPPTLNDDLHWNESGCSSNPTKVAAATLLTFILTCILCAVLFCSWYHRLFPKIASRPLNLRSLRSRGMSRNIAPVRSRAARAYNQMQDEGIYMRPSSSSWSEDSRSSTSSSFERGNRYVITESNVDPISLSGRQLLIDKLGPKPSTPVSRDSRHTYMNTDIMSRESNYTALCNTENAVRSSVSLPPSNDEHINRDLNRKSLVERKGDSRIYMDLS